MVQATHDSNGVASQLHPPSDVPTPVDSFHVAVTPEWLKATAKKQRKPRASKTDPEVIRRRMESAVEKLIAALDALDKLDEDIEQDDEPEDGGDDEPSLASMNPQSHGGDQVFWTAGANDEREDEHDGAEPCEEGEPALGSFDRLINQEHAWKVCDVPGAWPGEDREHDPADGREGDDEREHDPAENGIADQEALDEIGKGQWGGYV